MIPLKKKHNKFMVFYADSTKSKLYLQYLFVVSISNANWKDHRNPQCFLYNLDVKIKRRTQAFDIIFYYVVLFCVKKTRLITKIPWINDKRMENENTQ